MKKKPDLIISGINAGANVGQSLLYSGTISAASEGTLLGIPSIAISLDALRDMNFSTSKVVAKKIASLVINNGLPKDTLLNVNVPKDIKGGISCYQVTRQGAIYFKDNFEKREDPRGRIYYWMSGEVKDTDSDLESDGVAIKKGYVSVTPLQLQMTNFDFIDELNDWSF